MNLDVMTQRKSSHPPLTDAELETIPRMRDFNLAVIGIEDKRDIALLTLVFNSLTLSDFRRFVAELEHIEATEKHNGHQIRFVKKAAALYEDDDKKAGKAEADGEDAEDECLRARREKLVEKYDLSGKVCEKPEYQRLLESFGHTGASRESKKVEKREKADRWYEFAGFDEEPWYAPAPGARKAELAPLPGFVQLDE